MAVHCFASTSRTGPAAGKLEQGAPPAMAAGRGGKSADGAGRARALSRVELGPNRMSSAAAAEPRASTCESADMFATGPFAFATDGTASLLAAELAD